MNVLLRPQYLTGKRWRDRHERWVAQAETINPDEYGFEVIKEATAKAFILQHHYSSSMPASRLCVGMYRKTGVAPAHLCGVAVFSVPIQGKAICCYTGFAASDGVELGRIAMLEEVPFNAESFALKRCFQILRQEKGPRRGRSSDGLPVVEPGVRAVLSYADPMERRNALGELTKPAHAGQIYQASNAVFAGRAKPRMLWLGRDGQVISERALSKVRNQERGHAYAERLLEALGAERRRLGEEPADWLKRVLPAIAARVRHPGNFAFVFGLDREAKARVSEVNAGGLLYPRLANTP